MAALRLILAHRDARLLYLSQWLLMLLLGGARFVFPWLLVVRTGSAASAALPWALGAGAYVLAAIPAGIVGDRVSRRQMLAVVSGLLALLLAALTAAAAAGGLAAWTVWLGAFLVGVALPFLDSAAFGTLVQLLGERHLTGSGALLIAAETGGQLAGALLFGLLATLGEVPPLVGMGAVAVAAAVACLAIRDPLQGEHRGGAGLRQARAGLALLLGEPRIRAVLAVAVAANLAIGSIPALIVPFAHLSLGLGGAGSTAVVTAGGLAAVAGSLLAVPARARLGLRRSLVPALVGGGSLLAVAGLKLGTGVAVVGYVLGFGLLWQGLAVVLVVSERQRGAPPGAQSLIATSSRMCVWIALFAGSFGMGQLSRVVSLPAIVLVSGLALVAAGGLAAVLLRPGAGRASAPPGRG